jgi:hypothetical protein
MCDVRQKGCKLNYQVPIGLLLGSQGGTPSGAWVNPDAITNGPVYKSHSTE